MIRIRFGGHYTIIRIRSLQNSIGNFETPILCESKAIFGTIVCRSLLALACGIRVGINPQTSSPVNHLSRSLTVTP